MGIAYGVDLGWVSQLEEQGYTWADENGNRVDPIEAVKDKGANAVRLRVFVDPPEEAVWTKDNGTTCILGYCDAKSVLAVAKHVKALGMDLMIDFHYSDHFADPQYQDIPAAWVGESDEALGERVYQHTKEVLSLLKENDITPTWVEVGNEINSGILLPSGSFNEHPATLVKFLNRGYEGVKAIFPDCQVVTHLTVVHKPEYVPRPYRFNCRNLPRFETHFR